LVGAARHLPAARPEYAGLPGRPARGRRQLQPGAPQGPGHRGGRGGLGAGAARAAAGGHGAALPQRLRPAAGLRPQVRHRLSGH
nr:hypothetical protein [Tanacetum cinerariifolium]